MCNWSSRRLPPDFLTYYDELLGTWKRRLGNRHDAEDIAHETVLRMLEADAASVLKPRAYLHQTARILVTDEYRRRARHEIVSLDDLQNRIGRTRRTGSCSRTQQFTSRRSYRPWKPR